MILVVATLRVLPHKVGEYEALVRDLLPQVKAAEPDALVYDVGRSRDDPLVYRVIEVYRDQAAMDLHLTNKVLDALKPAMLACLDGEIDIKIHDTI